MLFIQNRYPDDFFCIFLSLFFLIAAPHRGNYDTETLFYHLYYRLYRLHLPYPCPTPRNMINNRERHNTRNDTPIILCQPLSTYKYSHCSARKRRKTTHPRSPVVMPHHEQGRTTLPFADQLSEPQISSTAEWRLPTHTASVRQNFCH